MLILKNAQILTLCKEGPVSTGNDKEAIQDYRQGRFWNNIQDLRQTTS